MTHERHGGGDEELERLWMMMSATARLSESMKMDLQHHSWPPHDGGCDGADPKESG